MDKPLSTLAKLLLLGAGGLAVVAGPILFLFPSQTQYYFAWTIKHPLTPVFMGANYFGGIGALWALRANRWSFARVLIPGIFIFAITQLLATLIHIPIFNWSHPIAWAWLFVYVVSPIATAVVYLSMEYRYTAPRPEEPSLPQLFTPLMIILAAVSGIAGIALFIWPSLAPATPPGKVVAWWAWSLTPLTARVVGGWYLAAGTLYFTIARQRSYRTVKMGVIGLFAVTALQLFGALTHNASFDGPALSIVLYLLNSAIVFALAALILTMKIPEPSILETPAS